MTMLDLKMFAAHCKNDKGESKERSEMYWLNEPQTHLPGLQEVKEIME